MRTLLMDANLRDPCIHGLFGVPAERAHGLAECLASDETVFADFMQPDVLPDLSVMFAGAPPENPQELLSSLRFQAMMQFCMREFHATIIDTAPANICADARRVSTVTGYSLIVARCNLSFVDDVKTLADQLASDRASVVGCVVNEA
jgi:Mrp family chromosome partitioning ATPase